MLDIKWIRENPEALDAALNKRGASAVSSDVLALDEARRQHIAKVQEAQERRNAACHFLLFSLFIIRLNFMRFPP